jgi:hypothetical protein
MIAERIYWLMTTLRCYVPNAGPLIASTVGVQGKKMHKQIKPTRKLGRSTVYVMPCPDHEQPRVTVPVDVMHFDPVTRVHQQLGRARCCPICWTILSIVEGDELFMRFEGFHLGVDELTLFVQGHAKKPRLVQKTSLKK